MPHAHFIPLRVHSAFSLAEGAIKLKDLLGYCTKHQVPAVSLCDTNNLFGALEFSLNAVKSGVQPIIGTQINVAPLENDPRLNSKRSANDVILDVLALYATSEAGYQNLIKIVSQAYLGINPMDDPHVSLEFIKQHADDLIVLTGGHKGALNQLLFQDHDVFAQHYLTDLKDTFGDRLYIEIERLNHASESKVEPKLLDNALKQSIPIVGTNEAFFIDSDQHEAHDALSCIAEGAYVLSEDRKRLTPHYRLKTPKEMAKIFADLPEALENTIRIAQRCHFFIEPQKPALPSFPTEKGEKQEIHDQAVAGLERRLEAQVFTDQMDHEEKTKIKETYFKRLEHELFIINKMGYDGYFLIVSDFIKWAKEHNIPVGPGRGSGAGSIVAWSLTITDIDPIRFGLLFERFLNPERVSMPDFDIDFCQDRRDEVINYVKEKYGDGHVAQIITFGKLQARAVIRDVGRVLSMPYGQVDKICKLIPSNPANPISLPEALQQEPQLKEMANEDQSVAKLLDIGQQLEGLYRHASTHAAGLVIGSKPLNEIVAVYQDTKNTLPATQFNMKFVELTGLVKFDFLGLKTLTVMQRSCDLLKNRHINVDLSQIPLDDTETFKLLQRVETVGVFQLESAGMQDVVRKLQPNRFEEVIALVALYRPGPMDDIPRYLACKHGEEKVTYPHPLMERILSESFGVMIYQEQVMQIAQDLGGYSLGGADLLRRAMGKKIKSEMDAQREIFITGCKENNIDEGLSNQIFDQMAKFAGYGFNKCHSAPYGLIAYQTAFLKANYPVEFMAATMSYDMNNTDKLFICKQELERMEIPLLQPDVNKSFADFSVETNEEGTLSIRYALAAIKNVGEAAIDMMTDERTKNGPFKDIYDLAKRLDSKVINKRLLENLITSGAFDSLHDNRAQLFESIEDIVKFAGAHNAHQSSGQFSLFNEAQDSFSNNTLRDVDSWSSTETLQREFDAVGFYLSAHPIESYQDLLKKMRIKTIKEVENTLAFKETFDTNVAGVIMGKKERLSKKGNRFAFVQLSDQTGMYETVLFGESFTENREHLEPGTQVMLSVTARLDEGMMRLSVNSMDLLSEIVAHQQSIINMHVNQANAYDRIKKILDKAGPGHQRIRLNIPFRDRNVSVSLPGGFNVSIETQESLERVKGVTKVAHE